MMSQSLSGAWQFRQVGESAWLPASVPGGAHTDLMAAGRIPDPFVGDNERRVQWVAEGDWEYRRAFVAAPELLAEPRVLLLCDGLDTLAELWLNGQLVGQAENMFRQHRWDVTALLRAGENELLVRFRSPVRYVAERERARRLPGVGEAIPGGQHLRKAPSHFGWDWGPQLPAIGIWKDIRLEGHRHARLDDVSLRQQHDGGRVTLRVAASVESWEPAALDLRVSVAAPDGGRQSAQAAFVSGRAAAAIEIAQPQLWWPNGYGAQPLYQVDITLHADGAPIETRRYQVGLRTLELRQQADGWGRSFGFVVNGVPIFAKGANWIPSDSFPTRITDRQLADLIGSAAACNHNMLRVWGGGYYEFESFYDLCDRYGLLVWQDFMFSCSVYPMGDEAFLSNVRAEVAENVRRLRHRACLALWCGNNEMEQGWAQWGWDRPDTQDLKAEYVRFFHQLLPAWVRADDPDHDYWPSSPSSNLPLEVPQSDAAGDTHLWTVWHALKPFEEYRAHPSRFVSEFGFQSLPALPTIATYAEPADWNMTSYVMEHHQRNRGGNGRIIAYMTDHFRLPNSFDSLVYLTQLLQAEAMRVGIEHWRRLRERCGGALYWQLNDCWPVASWSSIDYYGRWKALQYATRRMYAPILLSVEDAGDQAGIYVTNDTTATWDGEVRWSLQTMAGERLLAGEAPLAAAPLATTAVRQLDLAAYLSDGNRRGRALVCELWQAGARRATSVVAFAPHKHVELLDPALAAELQTDGSRLVVHVSGRALARFVEVGLEGADVRFSDNYFDLPAGETVAIACPLPEGWSLEQTRDALRLRSLFDTY